MRQSAAAAPPLPQAGAFQGAHGPPPPFPFPFPVTPLPSRPSPSPFPSPLTPFPLSPPSNTPLPYPTPTVIALFQRALAHSTHGASVPRPALRSGAALDPPDRNNLASPPAGGGGGGAAQVRAAGRICRPCMCCAPHSEPHANARPPPNPSPHPRRLHTLTRHGDVRVRACACVRGRACVRACMRARRVCVRPRACTDGQAGLWAAGS